MAACVSHGGCAAIKTPDGRVLLYDGGANAGPHVAKRQIAPYLWHRGIRRIDEVTGSASRNSRFG